MKKMSNNLYRCMRINEKLKWTIKEFFDENELLIKNKLFEPGMKL